MRRNKQEIRKSLEKVYDMADNLFKAGSRTRGILDIVRVKLNETGESFPSSIRQTDIEMIRTTGRSEWVERMMAQYYTEKPLVNTDITRTPMAAQVLPNQLDLFDSQLSDEKLHLIYSELIDIKNLLTARS